MSQRRDRPPLEAPKADRRRQHVSPLDTTRQEVGAGSVEQTSELPTQIGPYRILESLGSGGMGEVFLAQDVALDRKVALKRVRTDRVGEEELVRRFELEARVTALLQHPSIIPVYHFVNEKEQGAFYTMRPVEGMTLGELIADLREGSGRSWATSRASGTWTGHRRRGAAPV